MPVATRIVHFTGYEMPLDLIRVADARDRLVGHMLGTADMLAQMADRCYLEKCRDRLYAEFVLGDVAAHKGADGVQGAVRLRARPAAPDAAVRRDDHRQPARQRIRPRYRHVEPLFGGINPYMDAIHQNVEYLRGLARSSRWPLLRRNPPVFTVEQNADAGHALAARPAPARKCWGAPAPVSPS